jgi:hypothetical protein
MPKGQSRSYRSILGHPIFRPELWHSNRNLLSDQLRVQKILMNFKRADEDSHLEQMAIYLGIVSRGHGIWPQIIWHEGWERDLTIALAAKVFPEFSPLPLKKRGTKKGVSELDIDLFNAVHELRNRNTSLSVLSACTHLSRQVGGKWNGKKTSVLRVTYNRISASLRSRSPLAKQFDRVTEFAREWIEHN